jgi:23S rRNA pseudouridine1911/1915/1917 synthase
MQIPTQKVTLIVPEHEPLERIDRFVAKQLPAVSRNLFQKMLADEQVTINGKKITKPSSKVRQFDAIEIDFAPLPPLGTPNHFEGDLGVSIIHEDKNFLIINKPAGLIVHAPTKHSITVTLVDWLLTHFKGLADVGDQARPGIVHRLDKDTSGLIIIARNNYAHAQLSTMFKNRTIKKTYRAVVHGTPQTHGSVDFSIMRHPTLKHKMAHIDPAQSFRQGRDAKTDYRVLEKGTNYSVLELKPETGRTHQIRVHCAAIGHPIVGDSVYGTPSPLIARQALHAYQLNFTFEGTDFSFTAPLPEDFVQLVTQLN